MDRVSCVNCFAATLLLLSACPVQAQCDEKPTAETRIVGTVLDQQGQPLKNISVSAVLKETGMYMPFAVSSDGGQFVIGDLEPGTYDIYGESNAAGYPNTTLSFYGGENPIEVTLGDCGTATVVLVLGPKAGVLSGTLLDSVTGKDIESAHAPRFIVERAFNREDSIEFSGPAKFRWLVPPWVEVTLKVTVEGFRPWLYADPSDPSKLLPFQVESGEEKILNIELERDTQHKSPK